MQFDRSMIEYDVHGAFSKTALVDGVTTYGDFMKLVDHYQCKATDEFKIAYDLQFNGMTAEPNFGSLVVGLVMKYVEDAYHSLLTKIVDPSEYTIRYRNAMAKIESLFSMIEYAILHSTLFDAYICESYFYGKYGEYETLSNQYAKTAYAAVKCSELKCIKRCIDTAVLYRKLKVNPRDF